MTGPDLASDDHSIRLIEPMLERDARLGVTWLNGSIGHESQRLMGNVPSEIKDTTLEQQQELVRRFIEQKNEINWMIEVDGSVVGSIWVHLEADKLVGAPSISVMIGDPMVRGRGVGRAAVRLVIDWARDELGVPLLMRALTDNVVSKALIVRLGGTQDGPVYRDDDDLEWQNYRLPN